MKKVRKKPTKKKLAKKKINGLMSFKYIIPSIIGLILIVLVLENKFIPKDILGNVYSIDDAINNYGRINIGDTINYEINGYSDWQVIDKNDNNELIEIVSKGDAENLSLEMYKDKDYYENLFQETANKYIDNKYVLGARSVNSNDLDKFSYDTDFWLNDNIDSTVKTSQSEWTYKNYKMYIIPSIIIHDENAQNYNVGDNYYYPDNGIENWIITSSYDNVLNFIPAEPVEITVEDFNTNIISKQNDIITSFKKEGVDGVGNFVHMDSRMVELPDLIGDFLNQQTERIIFLDGCNSPKENWISGSACGRPQWYYENGSMNTYKGLQFKIPVWQNPSVVKTLGYRPVLTISLRPEAKSNTDEIQIGDYVKYNANGYENWKVLSTDESKDTLDIISGSVVKNITLNGTKDYSNLESILQTEADKYKAEENIISVRSIKSDDISTLNKMNDNLSLEYWTSDKKTKKKDNAVNYAGSNTLTMNTTSVGIMYYDFDEAEIIKKWQPLSLTFTSNNEDAANYYRSAGIYINPTTYYEGDQSYTAGLRPIITLRKESTEKLDEEEVKKVEDSSKKIEKVLSREQASKNASKKGNDKIEQETNKETLNNGKNSQDNIKNSNSTKKEKIVYKDKPFYKYGFILFLTTSIIELIIIMLLLKKIKK